MRTSSIGQIFGDFGAPSQINPVHAGAYTRPVRTYIRARRSGRANREMGS